MTVMILSLILPAFLQLKQTPQIESGKSLKKERPVMRGGPEGHTLVVDLQTEGDIHRESLRVE